MNRPLALLLVPVLAVVVWLALRLLQSEPELAPAAPTPEEPPVASAPTEIPVAATVTAAEADTQRVAAATEGAGQAQPPIPEDSVWLDVRVVDAERQPVSGAEVIWATGDAWQQVALLPEAERVEFRGDQELIARRFGWQTRTDQHGLARVACAANGATVHATSSGRYATGYVGGQRETPKEGWVLELEADLTLRARLLDARGQPAVGGHVGILMVDAEGKDMPNRGWIRARTAKAPDAIVEFSHVQRWLRQSNGRKRELDVARWKVAPVAPGVDGPAIEFDVDAPPAEPIELRLPPTGRMLARLVHDGQVYRRKVEFQAYRGDLRDTNQRNHAPRFAVDADGWARLPFVAIGGQIVVVARAGTGEVTKVVDAPIGQGEELRVELSTEEIFCLHGQFVGPDGTPLAEATVQTEYDFEISMGTGSVETDSHGRFVWLLSKGYKDTAPLKRLVFSRLSVNEPARSVTVAPREIRRGNNDLGVLRLAPESVVVAGRFEVDAPQSGMRVWFQVEALDERRGSNGEERWRRIDGLTQQQQDGGTFEVRGAVKAVRHRLRFPGTDHLPVAPVEFRLGQEGLVIPVAVGNRLTVTCLVDESVPNHLLSGQLVPAFDAPVEHRDERDWSWRQDRYRVDGYGRGGEGRKLTWSGLPSGTYSLEIGLKGLSVPPARIADVVLPLPEGGDPRLVDIDLRGKITFVDLQLKRPAGVEADGEEVLAFAMPQADEQFWQGLPFHEDKLRLPVVPGPIELMVLGGGCRPKRFTFSAAEVSAGKLALELQPWPHVELLVAGVPELPAGTTLHLHCIANVAQARDTRRYRALGSSGGLDSYFEGRRGGGEVKDGRATVWLGEGTYRLGAYLRASGNQRAQSLRSITPGEIVGGDNLAPITVQLSADELRAALAKLAEGAK